MMLALLTPTEVLTTVLLCDVVGERHGMRWRNFACTGRILQV